jgi:hypothetical protein
MAQASITYPVDLIRLHGVDSLEVIIPTDGTCNYRLRD